MIKANSVWAVVPAAGIGRRYGASVPKQYDVVGNQAIISHTLDALFSYSEIKQIWVSVQSDDSLWGKQAYADDKRVVKVAGGESRFISVFNALKAMQAYVKPDDWVLVHDAVRPCVNEELLIRLLTAIEGHAVGGILAIPMSDTVKSVKDSREVVMTLPRDAIWRAQTPQAFRYQVLFSALETASLNGYIVTDESSAVERMGLSPLVVRGSSMNIKITTPEDRMLFEWYQSRR